MRGENTTIGASDRAFISRKKPDWERLEALLRKVQTSGVRRLQEDEALEVARLYRKATSDLAQAQTYVRDAEVLQYLNGLVGRSHGIVYRTPSFSFRGIVDFFLWEYPARVRRHKAQALWAAAILFGTMGFGFLLVAFDFEARDYLLPDGFRTIEKELVSQERWAEQMTAEIAPMSSAFIMANNIRVTFLAFATGVFLGLGTFLVLAFNGLQLGAIMGVVHHYGRLGILMAFVASHGVIELACICIGGGAGFVLASGMVSPGDLSVKDALIERGRESGLLVLGTVPLLVLAGTIEGFVSPLPIPGWTKGVFAIFPAMFLVWYLLHGRSRGRAAAER